MTSKKENNENKKNKNEKVVLVIVDSLDWRWINNTTMPDFSNFLKRGQTAKLNSLLGFSASIYACLWPSAYPRDHDVWCHFFKKKNLKRVGFIKRNFYNLIPEIISIPLRFYYNKLTHKEPGVAIFPPLEDLHYFDRIHYDFKKKPQPINGHSTIFQVLGKKANWTFHKSVDKLKIPKKDKGNPFDVHFLGEFDYIAHHHSHVDNFMKNSMLKIDKWLSKLHNFYRERYDKLHFIVMSDHGQEEIKKFIDLESLIKKTKLKLFRDYLVFYESGFARFWTKNSDVKEKIKQALSNVKEGRFLTEKEVKKYNIDTENNNHGNLFFVLEPGNLIFPNYHQRLTSLKHRYKGMHGYAPDHISMKGVFCYLGPKKLRKNQKEIQIVDIIPSILKVLDTDKPKTMKGKSVWKN